TERWSVNAAVVQASSVEEEIEIPVELTLNANYPDPFSSTTTINYTVPEQDVARIDVYNVLGQLVALLTNRVHAPGTYTLTFDGSDLPNGVYFLTLDFGGTRKVERMIVVR
ncbi:MAG: T9SS type A sorting domain-containing protein, partial [Rhodothermales bacterium]|nr:T9SS type A sorting domain-containing protein [Rhodothermales bacterium]